MNTNLTFVERCVFEASTARMVCTGRLSPETVIERLSNDLELFLKLSMPAKYRCFKEIDFMFKDLRGPIVDRNLKLKDTVHWYIVNQAITDIDEYRASLPSEAVYEICYCLKERAGLLKNKPDQYKWEKFLKNIQSVLLLYKQNELSADTALCYLDIMDEATAELNIDSELRPVHVDKMQEALFEVEKLLPQFKEHPILNEIYLRLAIYCFVMDDIEKSKEYYRRYRRLGEFSIMHFAPWLRGKYSIISLAMLVVGYVETVDKIAKQDLSKEISQIQDWFKCFHNRNGYFEALVFGRVLGSEVIPLYLEPISTFPLHSERIAVDDIKEAWLVIPALVTKIKCNGSCSKIIGIDGLFSNFTGMSVRYCDVNHIVPDMRNAIERIVELIKSEMPDYLIDCHELNQLAEDCWFNVVIDEVVHQNSNQEFEIKNCS